MVFEDCSGQDLTITYDDANRTASWSHVGGPYCFNGIISTTWDTDGMVDRMTVFERGTTEYTTLETGEICVD